MPGSDTLALAMKRHSLAALTAFAFSCAALASTASDASAQQAPAAPAPAASVRVHLRTFKNKSTARMYIRRPDGSYTLVCASPCTADITGNSELRVTLANNDEEPHSFALPSDLGPEVDLEVRPASVGPFIGSIVLLGTGGAFVLSGLVFIALADVAGTSSGSGYSYSGANRDLSTTYKTTGYVMIGIGAAAAVAGFVWLLTRSHEPQVRDAPHREADVYGRGETLLGDVAVAKPRDPSLLVPAPSTPLQYGFSF
jgi:hypothetical protein